MAKKGLFVGMLAKVTIVTLALTLGMVLAGCAPASDSSSSSDAALSASATTIKGVAVASLGIPNATLGLENPGAVTISTGKAANTTNATTFVTSFAKSNAAATVKVVKYASSVSGTYAGSFAADAAYNGTDAITTGDFFVIEVTAEDGSTVRYYKIVVTVAANNVATLSAGQVKGAAVSNFGTPNTTLGSETAGAVVISTAQASGAAATSFTATSPDAAITKVVKYATSDATTNFESTDTAYNNEAITDNDFFIIKVTAEDTTTKQYYKVVVTVSANILGGTASITGGSTPPQVGETLTANTGGITGSSSLLYQWVRNNGSDADISGAASATYALAAADIGYTIKVKITASDAAGVITSPATAVVVKAAFAGTAPTVTTSVPTGAQVKIESAASTGLESGKTKLTFTVASSPANAYSALEYILIAGTPATSATGIALPGTSGVQSSDLPAGSNQKVWIRVKETPTNLASAWVEGPAAVFAKTLVLTGISATVFGYASEGGGIGVFPVGTTPQQALAQTGIVAGAGLEQEDVVVSPTPPASGPYTITIPLYTVDDEPGDERWTGSGPYDIYVMLDDGETEHYYKASSVNFSSATTTVPFGSASAITLP
jgi:hypothetical protein